MINLFSVLNRIGLVSTLLVVLLPQSALATQGHGHPAGLYAHQMAHAFFIFSMGLFIFWLRERNLVRSTGWRYIQYASFFFILWNLDAFLVHYIEDQTAMLDVVRLTPWEFSLQVHPGFEWLAYVYYVAKLDHLLSVPALYFLYVGLKKLLGESQEPKGGIA